MILYIIQASIVGLSLALTAIPLQAWEIAGIRADGMVSRLLLVANPVLSDLPRAVVILLLLAQLPSWFLEAGRAVGGAVLIYVVWQAMNKLYAAEQKLDSSISLSKRPLGVPRSLALWLLDPVPHLLWATSIGPLVLGSWRHAPAWGLVSLGSFYGALIVGVALFCLLVVVSKRHGSTVARMIAGLYMIAILVLAFVQIWRGGEALIARFF